MIFGWVIKGFWIKNIGEQLRKQGLILELKGQKTKKVSYFLLHSQKWLQ